MTWGKLGKPTGSLFLMVVSILLTFFFVMPLQASMPASVACLELPSKTSNKWSIDVSLACALADAGTISVERLFDDQPGFADDFTLSADRHTITYNLFGTTADLPANADVAVIVVQDATCGGTHHYLVRTDGIGTMLILDEM
jgi:hypothetical protein